MDKDNIETSTLFKMKDDSMDSYIMDTSALLKTDDDSDISSLSEADDESVEYDGDISTLSEDDDNSDTFSLYKLHPMDEMDEDTLKYCYEIYNEFSKITKSDFLKYKKMLEIETTDFYSSDQELAASACKNKYYFEKCKNNVDSYTTFKDSTISESSDFDSVDDEVGFEALEGRAYLEKYKIYVYLDDAIAQMISFNAKNEENKITPREFLKEYFNNVKKGTHVLFRKYSFINATLYNRLCVLKRMWDIYKALLYNDIKRTVKGYHSLLLLIWPDFPFDVVQASFKSFEKPGQKHEVHISFFEFFKAFKSSFCVGRFNYEENIINDELETQINNFERFKKKSTPALLKSNYSHAVKEGRNQKEFVVSIISNLDSEFKKIIGSEESNDKPDKRTGQKLPRSSVRAKFVSKSNKNVNYISLNRQIQRNAKQLPNRSNPLKTKKYNAKSNLSVRQGWKNAKTISATGVQGASKSKQNVANISQRSPVNLQRQTKMKQLPIISHPSKTRKFVAKNNSSTDIQGLKRVKIGKIKPRKKKSSISCRTKDTSKPQQNASVILKEPGKTRKFKEEFPKPPSTPVTLIQMEKVYTELSASQELNEESAGQTNESLSSAEIVFKSDPNLNTFSQKPDTKNNSLNCQQRFETTNTEMETNMPVVSSDYAKMLRINELFFSQMPLILPSLQERFKVSAIDWKKEIVKKFGANQGTKKCDSKKKSSAIRRRSKPATVKIDKKVSSVSFVSKDASKSETKEINILPTACARTQSKANVKQLHNKRCLLRTEQADAEKSSSVGKPELKTGETVKMKTGKQSSFTYIGSKEKGGALSKSKQTVTSFSKVSTSGHQQPFILNIINENEHITEKFGVTKKIVKRDSRDNSSTVGQKSGTAKKRIDKVSSISSEAKDVSGFKNNEIKFLPTSSAKTRGIMCVKSQQTEKVDVGKNMSIESQGLKTRQTVKIQKEKGLSVGRFGFKVTTSSETRSTIKQDAGKKASAQETIGAKNKKRASFASTTKQDAEEKAPVQETHWIKTEKRVVFASKVKITTIKVIPSASHQDACAIKRITIRETLPSRKKEPSKPTVKQVCEKLAAKLGPDWGYSKYYSRKKVILSTTKKRMEAIGKIKEYFASSKAGKKFKTRIPVASPKAKITNLSVTPANHQDAERNVSVKTCELEAGTKNEASITSFGVKESTISKKSEITEHFTSSNAGSQELKTEAHVKTKTEKNISIPPPSEVKEFAISIKPLISHQEPIKSPAVNVNEQVAAGLGSYSKYYRRERFISPATRKRMKAVGMKTEPFISSKTFTPSGVKRNAKQTPSFVTPLNPPAFVYPKFKGWAEAYLAGRNSKNSKNSPEKRFISSVTRKRLEAAGKNIESFISSKADSRGLKTGASVKTKTEKKVYDPLSGVKGTTISEKSLSSHQEPIRFRVLEPKRFAFFKLISEITGVDIDMLKMPEDTDNIYPKKTLVSSPTKKSIEADWTTSVRATDPTSGKLLPHICNLSKTRKFVPGENSSAASQGLPLIQPKNYHAKDTKERYGAKKCDAKNSLTIATQRTDATRKQTEKKEPSVASKSTVASKAKADENKPSKATSGSRWR
ncbi:UPF0705 protein C11orf49 like protein [Argiope bruennichi]|uniref:Centriolar satellite-associated tubulin polyglutamylase complex regulator 1 n=1 Tax=Argiope bruennichi TaxID=94029 RepID=A0A8T0F3S6_ARGBR|nr:UPF0705 protein C11orf49 like protein [Argiope bruennichi]